VTALILTVCTALVLAAPPPSRSIPDPTPCILPTFIDLVGCKDGVVDPYGAFTVTVKDAGGFPVVGCNVEIVFAPDLKVYSASPGATVDCDDNSVSAISNANGEATFDLAGATINSNGVATGSGLNGATISVCGITIGQATVAVFDENGVVGMLGMQGGDLGAWLGDFGKQGTIGYKGRSDFNHDGSITGSDLSVWLKVFGLGRSTGGCGPLCP
jgi:hypothetical protein